MIKRVSDLLDGLELGAAPEQAENNLSGENIRNSAMEKIAVAAVLPLAPPKKKRLTVLLAAAVIAVFFCGAALAVTQTGLGEYLAKTLLANADSEELEQIETPGTTVTVSTDYGDVIFTVQETYFDGRDIYYTITATPPNSKTLLLPGHLTNLNMNNSASNYFGSHDAGDLNLAAFMAERGFTRIICIENFWGGVLEEDGTLVEVSEGLSTLTNETNWGRSFTLYAAVFSEWPLMPDMSASLKTQRKAEIEISVDVTERKPDTWTAEFPKPELDNGPYIESLKLEQTPVGTYATLNFGGIPDTRAMQSIEFDVINSKGVSLFGGRDHAFIQDEAANIGHFASRWTLQGLYPPSFSTGTGVNDPNAEITDKVTLRVYTYTYTTDEAGETQEKKHVEEYKVELIRGT
ncbi:MAG: DUF4179 domain-containing protein [Oscillospiraceae bacterium]|jgi:hypothetical protein|nr:DUF4179 domain-containing protein [Oscillospiraceae bacterium]